MKPIPAPSYAQREHAAGQREHAAGRKLPVKRPLISSFRSEALCFDSDLHSFTLVCSCREGACGGAGAACDAAADLHARSAYDQLDHRQGAQPAPSADLAVAASAAAVLGGRAADCGVDRLQSCTLAPAPSADPAVKRSLAAVLLTFWLSLLSVLTSLLLECTESRGC